MERQVTPQIKRTPPTFGERVNAGPPGLSTKMAATTRASLRSSEESRNKDVIKKVEPVTNPFISTKVETLLKTVLDAYLHKVKYDPLRCSKISQDICSVIKAKTKELNYDRYKLIVQVYVGQDSSQSIQMASRCLWNADVDAFAAATYRNDSLYGIAVVYGLYAD